MQDHRAKLDVPGIGTWALNGPREPVEFINDCTYEPDVKGNLWKHFEGASRRAHFVDPQRDFVLLDAQDEVLRADAISGELTTVVTLNRMEDGGFRRGSFVGHPVPIFVFELGLAVFRPDGQLSWFRDDLVLNNFFQRVANNRIVYFCEHGGKTAYDLGTGELVDAGDGILRDYLRKLRMFFS